MLHHPQKRIYTKDAIYFITTKTYNSYPYFEEDIFCRLLVQEIYLTQKYKKFDLIAYKINPDHVHFLMKPGCEFNYSQIMQFLKGKFSQNLNKIIGFSQTGNIVKIREDIEQCSLSIRNLEKSILVLKNEFLIKHGRNHDFPVFKWQKSFHFHIIKYKKELLYHIEYIKKQHEKHGLSENKYCFVDEKLAGKLSRFFQ